ncbi:hypothetical protein [Kribbella amoyensis]|nr:hypothetical protein [Kribbella amoyensis]
MQPLYDYSWVVGLVAGFVVYLALTLPASRRSTATTQATAGI